MRFSQSFSCTRPVLGLSLTLGFVFLCMLSPGVAAAQSPRLSASVLAKPDSTSILVLGESGALESIHPTTGGLIWRQSKATRPLLRADGVIWAQAKSNNPEGDLRIVALAETGQPISTFTADIPSRAWTSVDDALGKTFEARAIVDDGGAATFQWRSTELRVKGARAAMEIPNPPGSDPRLFTAVPSPLQVEAGSFRIDLANQRITTLESTAGPSLFDPQPGIPPRQSGKLHYLSADGRHLLISEPIADDRSWNKYRWRVVDRQTDRVVAERKSHVAWAPFQMHGPVLLVQERPWQRRVDGQWLSAPFQLRAFDAAGVEQWHRELRDTRFVGPYPS